MNVISRHAGAGPCRWSLGAAAGAWLICAGLAGTASAADSGSIAGKVTFGGAIPAAQKIQLAADPKCAAMYKEGLQRQAVAVKDGGLGDALVYVKSGVTGSYPAPTDPVVIDQEGCMYHPDMITLMVGQPLTIRNNDDTLHNIHPHPTLNKEFNVGEPRKGMEVTKVFDRAEVMIPTSCEVHPWMRAFISVFANPFYAVTADDGTFEIKGLPDGDYEVEAVHGVLKTVSGKVSVKNGKATKLDLAYPGS